MHQIFRSFISLVLHEFFCNFSPWQSVPSYSTSHCRYQSLSHSSSHQSFGSYFLVFGKCGVNPHCLYHDSLTLRETQKQSFVEIFLQIIAHLKEELDKYLKNNSITEYSQYQIFFFFEKESFINMHLSEKDIKT